MFNAWPSSDLRLAVVGQMVTAVHREDHPGGKEGAPDGAHHSVRQRQRRPPGAPGQHRRRRGGPGLDGGHGRRPQATGARCVGAGVQCIALPLQPSLSILRWRAGSLYGDGLSTEAWFMHRRECRPCTKPRTLRKLLARSSCRKRGALHLAGRANETLRMLICAGKHRSSGAVFITRCHRERSEGCSCQGRSERPYP